MYNLNLFSFLGFLKPIEISILSAKNFTSILLTKQVTNSLRVNPFPLLCTFSQKAIFFSRYQEVYPFSISIYIKNVLYSNYSFVYLLRHALLDIDFISNPFGINERILVKEKKFDSSFQFQRHPFVANLFYLKTYTYHYKTLLKHSFIKVFLKKLKEFKYIFKKPLKTTLAPQLVNDLSIKIEHNLKNFINLVNIKILQVLLFFKDFFLLEQSTRKNSWFKKDIANSIIFDTLPYLPFYTIFKNHYPFEPLPLQSVLTPLYGAARQPLPLRVNKFRVSTLRNLFARRGRGVTQVCNGFTRRGASKLQVHLMSRIHVIGAYSKQTRKKADLLQVVEKICFKFKIVHAGFKFSNGKCMGPSFFLTNFKTSLFLFKDTTFNYITNEVYLLPFGPLSLRVNTFGASKLQINSEEVEKSQTYLKFSLALNNIRLQKQKKSETFKISLLSSNVLLNLSSTFKYIKRLSQKQRFYRGWILVQVPLWVNKFCACVAIKQQNLCSPRNFLFERRDQSQFSGNRLNTLNSPSYRRDKFKLLKLHLTLLFFKFKNLLVSLVLFFKKLLNKILWKASKRLTKTITYSHYLQKYKININKSYYFYIFIRKYLQDRASLGDTP